jgi:hypothetical protein
MFTRQMVHQQHTLFESDDDILRVADGLLRSIGHHLDEAEKSRRVLENLLNRNRRSGSKAVSQQPVSRAHEKVVEDAALNFTYGGDVKKLRWLEKATYILRNVGRPISTRELLDIIAANEPERTLKKGFSNNMSTLMSDMYKARHKTHLERNEQNGTMYYTINDA